MSRDGRIIELQEMVMEQKRLNETKGQAITILKNQILVYLDFVV